MKKLLTLVIAGGMLAFYACGPSKAELEKREKAKQDSIHMADSVAAAAAAAAEKAKADSVAAAQEAAAKAAAEQAKADSIAAAATKGGKKPKTIQQKTKDEAKKATSGRG